MPVDLSVFGRQKTLLDQQALQDEFELKKQIAAQSQAELALKLQQAAKGQNLPAALQIASAYAKARDAGDIQGMNDIALGAKLFDKGIVNGADGYSAQAMSGYAPAVGGIEATKAGMKEQATSNVKQVMDPIIARGVQDQKNTSDLRFNPMTAAATDTAKTRAASTTAAQLGIGAAEDQYGNVTKLIDDIETSPGLSAYVGVKNPFQGGVPFSNAVISGSPAADFKAKLDRLGGTQFLEAFSALKGSGAITDIEGTKAQNAIASMQTNQSEEQFKKSLAEFKGIVTQGIERARAKAGTGAPSMPSPDAARAELIRRGVIK